MKAALQVLSGVVFWLAAVTVNAQAYPAKPIRLLVPFPAGGSTDLVARAIAPKLGELLGAQLVVDYKPGAGGSIGATEVARAVPDGHTILIVWDTHAVNHYVYKVQYDFAKSFEPISLLVQSPGILVARAGFAPSSPRELIEYARANPEKITYGSAGSGSSNHLSGLWFAELTKTQMTHVPYKGGGPLIADLLGGHVDIVFGTLPLYEQHVRSGKLKLIAVLSRGRLTQFPGVAAAAEIAPGFEAKTWFGLLAPAGTDRAIVALLNRAVVRTLTDASVKEPLAGRGFEIVASSAEAFSQFLAQESEAARNLVTRAGIRAE
jgi:tripartite-type tricarboxylate transporter receptor subunit TctC